MIVKKEMDSVMGINSTAAETHHCWAIQMLVFVVAEVEEADAVVVAVVFNRLEMIFLGMANAAIPMPNQTISTPTISRRSRSKMVLGIHPGNNHHKRFK